MKKGMKSTFCELGDISGYIRIVNSGCSDGVNVTQDVW